MMITIMIMKHIDPLRFDSAASWILPACPAGRGRPGPTRTAHHPSGLRPTAAMSSSGGRASREPCARALTRRSEPVIE